jgi:transcriptional regulator with XRE-family HTH domain
MTHQMQLKQRTGDGEVSSSKGQEASVNTKAQKIARLKNKAYRQAFVASQINVGLPFQIRALREQNGWKQSVLAHKAGMLQPRISAMERPGEAKFNLETLRRLAAAFDVALVVRFVPFSELVNWSETFNPDTFAVLTFEQEMHKGAFDGIQEVPQIIPTEPTRQAVYLDADRWVDFVMNAIGLPEPDPLYRQVFTYVPRSTMQPT